MWYCVARDDGDLVIGYLLRIWPDWEHIEFRYHGITYTVDLEHVFGVYQSLIEAQTMSRDSSNEQSEEAITQALGQFQEALKAAKARSSPIVEYYKTGNWSTDWYQRDPPEVTSPTKPGTQPSPSTPQAPSAGKGTDHPALAPRPQSTRTVRPVPSADLGVGKSATSLVSPMRTAQRLYNDKYEIFYPVGATVRTSLLVNSKLETIETDKPFNRLTRITPAVAAPGNHGSVPR